MSPKQKNLSIQANYTYGIGAAVGLYFTLATTLLN